MTSKFFTTREICGDVTAIYGIIGEAAFLVRGSEKALLIDTLTGVGSIKAFCRELTDLPLTVVNTHGHVDHLGGNAEFERVYMHPMEMDAVHVHGSVAKKIAFLEAANRMANLTRKGVGTADLVREKPYYIYPITDGEYFNLGGGKVIEAIHVPGHSRGSLAMLDVRERILFVGDSLNLGALLFLENSTSVEEYRAGLKHLKLHAHRFDRILLSHDPDVIFTPAQVDEAIALCEEIMEGKDDAVPCPEPPFFFAKKHDARYRRLDGKLANIRYDSTRVFKQERSKEIVDYEKRKFNRFD